MTRWSEIVNGLIQNKWARKVRSTVLVLMNKFNPWPQSSILFPFQNGSESLLWYVNSFFWQKIVFVKVEEQTHFRVDPKVNTDTNEVTPLDIAARCSSCKAQVQLFNVFAEYVQLPVESKIQAVRALIEMCKSSSYKYDATEIEREDPQKRSVLDMFKIHLDSLPLDKVTHRIFNWSCVN